MAAEQFDDFDSFPNLVTMFFARARHRGDAPFLWAKIGGEWQSISWAEAARQVAGLASALRKMGLEPGDRVMLVSENRPEWCIADLGIMAAGCVTVPTYITNTERDHQHIMNNSAARAVIVSTAKLAKALMPAALRSSECEFVISMEPLPSMQTGQLSTRSWADMVKGTDADVRATEAAMATVTRDNLRGAQLLHRRHCAVSRHGVASHRAARRPCRWCR